MGKPPGLNTKHNVGVNRPCPASVFRAKQPTSNLNHGPCYLCIDHRCYLCSDCPLNPELRTLPPEPLSLAGKKCPQVSQFFLHLSFGGDGLPHLALQGRGKFFEKSGMGRAQRPFLHAQGIRDA